MVKSLILCALCACGAPGSDKVFTKATPRAAADSARRAAQSPPPPRRPPTQDLQLQRYSGYYKRDDNSSRFQACGTKRLLEVTGSWQGRSSLQDRFRWNSVWVGRPMFGVLIGAIVTDTPKAQRGVPDSLWNVPRTRFYVTAVESLRTWLSGDCNGMRIP